MARIKDAWMGFETGSAQELNGANNGLAEVTTEQARTGTYALRVMGGAIVFGTGYATHVFEADELEFFFRFAWRIDAGAVAGFPYIEFRNSVGSALLTLYFHGPTQTFQLYRGKNPDDVLSPGTLLAAGNIVIRSDTWYLIEGHAVIDLAAGEFELKINAVTDIGLSGADTGDTGVRSFLIFGPLGAPGSYICLDDIAFNNPTGAFENSYPGLGGVYFLRANGDGVQTDFTPSAGVDHYAVVDDVPPNTTDWVQGLDPGATELFAIENTPAYVTQINVVQPVYVAAVAVSGSNELRDVVYDGAVIYSGDDTNTIISIAPDFVLYRGKQYYEQPDGVSGAFDAAALDGLQVGVEIPDAGS